MLQTKKDENLNFLYLSPVVKVLRNFHANGIIEFLIVAGNHRLLTKVNQETLKKVWKSFKVIGKVRLATLKVIK